MRYSIMLQVVTGMTLIMLGAAALFAWIENRDSAVRSQESASVHQK